MLKNYVVVYEVTSYILSVKHAINFLKIQIGGLLNVITVNAFLRDTIKKWIKNN